MKTAPSRPLPLVLVATVAALVLGAAVALVRPASGPPDLDALAFVSPAFGQGVAAVDVSRFRLAWRRDPKGSPRSGRPMHLEVDRARGRLWVGDLDGPGLVALDARTGETRASRVLPHEIVGIALSPDGTRIVGAARDALEAYVVDAATGALLGTVPTGEMPASREHLPGFFTAHPAFLEDGTVLVQDNVNGALVRIDPRGLRVLARFPVGCPVHAVERTPRGDHLVALAEGTASGVAPRVLILDAATGAPEVEIPVPIEGEVPRLHHGWFSPDGTLYWVASMGPFYLGPAPFPDERVVDGRRTYGRAVAVVDLVARKLLASAHAGRGAGHPILSPDGRELLVVNHYERFLSRFDPRTLEPRGELVLARSAGFGHGVAFTPRGDLLVLASEDRALVRLAPGGRIDRLPLDAHLGELATGW